MQESVQKDFLGEVEWRGSFLKTLEIEIKTILEITFLLVIYNSLQNEGHNLRRLGDPDLFLCSSNFSLLKSDKMK
jgi:hypothetical protein